MYRNGCWILTQKSGCYSSSLHVCCTIVGLPMTQRKCKIASCKGVFDHHEKSFCFVFGTLNNPTVSSKTSNLLFIHRIDKFSCTLLHTSVASSAITENHGGLFACIFSKRVRNIFWSIWNYLIYRLMASELTRLDLDFKFLNFMAPCKQLLFKVTI